MYDTGLTKQFLSLASGVVQLSASNERIRFFVVVIPSFLPISFCIKYHCLRGDSPVILRKPGSLVCICLHLFFFLTL